MKTHTRLRAGVSKDTLALGYGQVLKDHIISPLVEQGSEGLGQAVSSMGEYCLLREDLDDLLEVNQWPDKANTFRSVDSKTKAAFTRKCNKERVTLPYSIPSTLCKKRTRVGEEENIEEEETVENDLNIVIKRSKITGRDDRGRPKEKRRK